MAHDLRPWYSQKVYARYWKHYNQAMEWMQRHKIAYKRAMESLYDPVFGSPNNHPGRRYPDWDGDYSRRQEAFAQSSKTWNPPRLRQVPRNTRRRAAERRSEKESESEEDVEYDLSNMEITEELRQYFEQTERHREELRKQQQLDAEDQEMYVEADHDFHLSSGRSGRPPTEKPGERRMAEMRRLYGVGASKIQALETTMQLSFDRNCDKKQPKYWPIIPLKL